MENQLPQESFGTLTRMRQSFSSLLRSPLLRIGVILVILAAVPLTVYLSQQRQDVRQRAAEEPTPTPQPARVFITSTTYNGSLGGLAGADEKCGSLANAANLGGAWKAWLSDGTISASSRFTPSSGPYRLVDGTAIANDWSDLIDGNLAVGIYKDEFGNPKGDDKSPEKSWTNTNADGSIHSNTQTCNGWQGPSTFEYAGVGSNSFSFISGTSSIWTYTASEQCNNLFHLYCFEQPAPTPTPTPANSPTPTPTPTPPANNITASPNPCDIPAGGTTCNNVAIAYTYSNIPADRGVALCQDNISKPIGVSGSTYNATNLPVQRYGYVFKLVTPSSDCTYGTILASQTVIVNPALTPTPSGINITASPNPCDIPAGGTTCNTTVTYTFSNVGSARGVALCREYYDAVNDMYRYEAVSQMDSGTGASYNARLASGSANFKLVTPKWDCNYGTILASQAVVVTSGGIILDPRATYLRLDVALTGIGGAGNPDPKRKQREVTVEIIGANESPVATGTGSLTFDKATGSFKGLANLGRTFTTSGRYEIKVKVNSYLKKRIQEINQITAKTINPISTIITLAAGDISNDNQIFADDYNIILFCFGAKADLPTCGSNKENADLNDDGEIDGVDYNLFIRSLATIKGD